MSEMLPLVAIVVVGLLGLVMQRRSSLTARRLLLGTCTLLMLVNVFIDPAHRYISLLFVLLGVVYFSRLRAVPAQS